MFGRAKIGHAAKYPYVCRAAGYSLQPNTAPMFRYLINSFKRKMARRYFREYPAKIYTFNIPGAGEIRFANWENPLAAPKAITQNEINFFKKFIDPGDFVIDIGANIGHRTVAMALANGPSGLTLAFDPNPHVFKILQQNAGINGQRTNIVPLPYAITDEDGEFFYNSSEASFNNGGISREKTAKHGRFSLEQKIRGINLEKYLAQHYPERMARLKLIKIDTEGYDKEIIKSIYNLIESCKPIVITECFSKTTPDERFEHFTLLASKGYKLFHFDDFVEQTPVTPIQQKEDMLKWKHFDFYAIQP